MGAVWLARHVGLDVPCAVKFIHQTAAESAEIRARFEREAKAAAQLRSPHVVQILDHGVWEGSPYIAMELLEGEDLSVRIAQRGTLSPPEVASLAAQIGRALTKAHAAGLVHRDLKPANVFLVRDDDREIAKVLDFGVAKATSLGTDGNTKTGAVLGTPYYMSPEQARGAREVDYRSDLWALAVVVFECLTGRLPFMAEGFGELLVKIIVEPIPVPSTIALVPPGFDVWWARAVARDPAQRFQSAKEMTEALGIALGVTMPGPATGEHSGLLSSPALPSGAHFMPGTPMPNASSSPGMMGGATPAPMHPISGGHVLGAAPAPTPMQQAMSVATPARRSRLPLVVGAAVTGGVILGAAVFLAAGRGKSSPAGGAGASASAAVTQTAAPPIASAAVSATASPSVSESAAPVESAAPSAAASAKLAPTQQAAPLRPGPLPKATPSAKPSAAPKAKTDFGI